MSHTPKPILPTIDFLLHNTKTPEFLKEKEDFLSYVQNLKKEQAAHQQQKEAQVLQSAVISQPAVLHKPMAESPPDFEDTLRRQEIQSFREQIEREQQTERDRIKRTKSSLPQRDQDGFKLPRRHKNIAKKQDKQQAEKQLHNQLRGQFD